MLCYSSNIYNKETLACAAVKLFNLGIPNVELSACQYSETFIEDISKLSSSIRLNLHNYFPSRSGSFLINLASKNSTIIEGSLRHCQTALDLSAEIGAKYYAVHAGFLFDPQVKELGKSIHFQNLVSADEASEIFVKNITQLSLYAKERGVTLLVENNVLSKENLITFGQNPLLGVTPDETELLLNMLPKTVGLLLDVAHLKVSAQTLGFDPLDFMKKCDRFVQGYHLSDNDGTRDSHSKVSVDSWFWPHINKKLNYYCLEVMGVSDAEILAQYELSLGMLNL